MYLYWVCKSLVGYNVGGLMKFEGSGKLVFEKVEELVGVLKKVFKEYYIFLDFEEFIYLCYLKNDKW